MAGEDREERARAAADAARRVPGVAFLKPGLAGRLRASAARVGRGATRLHADPAAGVRVRPGSPWAVEVHLVLRHGHRALDVTRAVRAAVADSFGETPVHVTVTVSGMV